jgi:hypothetical protein
MDGTQNDYKWRENLPTDNKEIVRWVLWHFFPYFWKKVNKRRWQMPVEYDEAAAVG